MISQDQKAAQKTRRCPHPDCNTLAQQVSITSPPQYTPDRKTEIYEEIEATQCAKCKKMAYWIEGALVYPSNKTYLPAANRDMPINIKEIYQEAACIFAVSPRAAVALLRLGVQKLGTQLGSEGGEIARQIEVLIIQQLPIDADRKAYLAFDIKNEILLPATLKTDENSRIAKSLFISLNTIVEKAVSKQKLLNDGYDYLVRENTKQ